MLDVLFLGRYDSPIPTNNGNKAMFDFSSHYALVKSVMQTKAKEQHKPSLDNKASMAAYAKAVGIQGKASYGLPQADVMVIEYV